MMQRDSIKIRPASYEDIEKIAVIEKECIAEPWSENAFRSSFKSDKSILLTAKHNDAIIGFIEASFVMDEVNINCLAVTEAYRKKGIAKMLFEFLLGQVLNFAKFIMLEVRSKNTPAVNLYKKLNFKAVGLRKNFYSRPTDDAILMTYFIDMEVV